MGWRRSAVAALAALAAALPAAAQDLRLPVLVPLTGFVALEGTSQRNGALLAASQIRDVTLKPDVLDTQATPEAAITAWERVMGGRPRRRGRPDPRHPDAGAAAAGPGARRAAAHHLGHSASGRVGNPWFFRFFPSDATVKVAHARYVVEKLGAKRPAVIYQSTAYGQSGREQLARTLTELKAPPVLEESIAPTVNDLSPALLRAKAANADVIVLHLHAASTVLAVRQARQLLPDVPIVAGSAMHQPATAALLEPAELKGVCAETAASPISATRADAGLPRRLPRRLQERARRLRRRPVRRSAHAGPEHRRAAQGRAAVTPKPCASAWRATPIKASSRPIVRTARATWPTRPKSCASTAPTAFEVGRALGVPPRS